MLCHLINSLHSRAAVSYVKQALIHSSELQHGPEISFLTLAVNFGSTGYLSIFGYLAVNFGCWTAHI